MSFANRRDTECPYAPESLNLSDFMLALDRGAKMLTLANRALEAAEAPSLTVSASHTPSQRRGLVQGGGQRRGRQGQAALRAVAAPALTPPPLRPLGLPKPLCCLEAPNGASATVRTAEDVFSAPRVTYTEGGLAASYCEACLVSGAGLSTLPRMIFFTLILVGCRPGTAKVDSPPSSVSRSAWAKGSVSERIPCSKSEF